jgi:hypothetical protein
MSDQPDAETSTWKHTTLTTETSVPPAGFEPTVLASERPETHALKRAAIGIGGYCGIVCVNAILIDTAYRQVFFIVIFVYFLDMTLIINITIVVLSLLLL